MNDGRRRYEWQAGRQLKKVYVKADLKEGTKPGVDEQSGTVLKIAWSNGNLISGSVTSTQASAEVTRNGEDVTGEYAASAFAWKRDSGNAGADNTWNAAHAGKKAITLTAADLSGDVKISCTLTGSGATYGSITVDENMYASHTPGGLDANDVFAIENGELKVTASRGEMYALQDGEVKGAGAKLNGSITAQSRLFASQPEDVVEFAYDHNGLRTQKKVTKANGTVETTDYTLHGKPVTHLTRGGDKMHFYYDAQGRPAMVNFNTGFYSYVHNLQGDIVGIIDSDGELVVEYKYDAWGKPVSVRTLTTAYETLAEMNPFRYRGYVYDEETGLYYLRSRYYDACKCRFINEDSFAQLRGFNNIFSCVRNNPIRFSDPNGTSFINLATEIEYSEDFVVNIFSDAGIDMPQDYKSVTCYATGTEENNYTDGYIELHYRQEELRDDGITVVTTSIYKFEYKNHLPSNEAGGQLSLEIENMINALSFATQADPHPLAQAANLVATAAGVLWSALSGVMFAFGGWILPITENYYWDIVYGERVTSYINYDNPQASSRQYKLEKLIDGKWS